MTQYKKKSLVVVFAVFIGIIVGLIIASNFDLIEDSFARHTPLNTVQENSSSTVVPVNSDLENTSRAFVQIAKRVTPTVVSITSEKVVKVRDPFSNFFHNDDFFKKFFRSPRGGNGEREYRSSGLGSGVVVSPDGYILTNYHVIKDADEINVVVNKKEFDAEVIGTDPASDIAVIKINETNLPTITIGDSDKLEVGEWVLAIGNPFDLSLSHTVTSGIISAKGRSNLNLGNDLTYQDFIQTDAAINPGNSGGALVNIKGELIGINTAIYAGGTGGNVGIGFAIPINLAKQVMDDLITKGKVIRGYLGVYITTPDEDMSKALKLKNKSGAVITEVIKNTPAEKAGLKKYDVVVEVNGKKIEDDRVLTNLIGSLDPDETINLKIIRDGRIKYIKIRLEERPSSNPVAQSSSLDRLGVEVTDLTERAARRYGYEDEEGVIVTLVDRGSLAYEKGLRAGDLIIEVDRERISSVRELEIIVAKLDPGDIMLLQIKRDSNNHFIAMKIPNR